MSRSQSAKARRETSKQARKAQADKRLAKSSTQVSECAVLESKWRKAGLLYDKSHCVFVCFLCKAPCIVGDPAKHFNSYHLTKVQKADPALRVSSALFANVPINRFQHLGTEVIKPVVGFEILEGLKCNECGCCTLRLTRNSSCGCNARSEKVKVQRIREPGRPQMIVYQVEGNEIEAPAQSLTYENTTPRETSVDCPALSREPHSGQLRLIEAEQEIEKLKLILEEYRVQYRILKDKLFHRSKSEELAIQLAREKSEKAENFEKLANQYAAEILRLGSQINLAALIH